MPRLSIVIPVFGNLRQLEEGLVSVLENRPDDCQVVVVLAQPYDDPYDLKEEVLFVAAPSGSGLARSINAGIRASFSPVVHVLACGAEVTPGWADAALPHFDCPDVAAVAPAVIGRNGSQDVRAGVDYCCSGLARPLRLPAATAAWEAPSRLCGPDILAAFYRKAALEAVGLLSEEVGDDLLGIDMALRLRQMGLRSVLEPQARVVADLAAAPVSDAFQAGKQAEQFFWRWASQNGWIRSLAAHGLLVAGECGQTLWRPATAARLAGRLAGGYCTFRHAQPELEPAAEFSADPLAVTRPHFSPQVGCLKHSR